MEGLLTTAFKYLKDKPDTIAMLVVIGVMCWLTVMLMRTLRQSFDKIGTQSVILQELTTLIKTLVYRGRTEQ
jgi:hypothetical protein